MSDSTIGDLATAAIVLSTMLKDIPDDWENSVNPAEFRRWDLREKLLDAWKVEHERVMHPPVPVPPPAPPTPPPYLLPSIQEPRPSVLSPTPAATGTDLPDAITNGSLGEDYEHWVVMAEELGRNPADFVRQWFRDIEGGWDKSESPMRIEQYRKAFTYYRNNRAHHGGGGGGGGGGGDTVDTTKCFKCGAPGIEKRRHDNNALYYECSDRGCGFNGDRGWVPTRWDPESWAEKRDRLESTRRRGQQRGGGFSGGGRSYGGRRQ